MQGLTVGRMVHYVTTAGQHFAAVVADVLDPVDGLVVLAVMVPDPGTVSFIPTSFSADFKADSWHWIERA